MTHLETPSEEPRGAPAPLSRRKALARLGIAAAVAYTAPTVLHLDRSANAFILPTPCQGKGKGKGARPCYPNPGKGQGGGPHGFRRSGGPSRDLG